MKNTCNKTFIVSVVNIIVSNDVLMIMMLHEDECITCVDIKIAVEYRKTCTLCLKKPCHPPVMIILSNFN